MHFFINRPNFAIVISLLITILGLISLFFLRVEQFPTLTPPEIQVFATYPGASSETLATTVATPLESAFNSIENLAYSTAICSSTGDLQIHIFFQHGTDIDRAVSDVQNVVNNVKSSLPDDVQRLGINVSKTVPSFIMVIGIESENNEYDSLLLNNYAKIHLNDELTRIDGVGRVFQVGAKDYAMRLWMDPDAMGELNITTADIVRSVKEQNANYPIGEIGRPPTTSTTELNFPVITQGTLSEIKEYENVILRSSETGATVRVKDVAKVELGAFNYNVIGEHQNKDTALLVIYQQYGANSLQIKNSVIETMERLSKNFPKGMKYTIPFDATIFIKKSIQEVIKTLIEAAFLVTLVVFLFLQNWRASLIPVLALIISIMGTFAGMYLLDLSINTLTLFGLVLAAGIVVDDAIVVVENVERNMREKKMNAFDASLLTMKEVTGPVIAIVFVLCAVFIPVAFITGMTGVLYKQFALTISISMVISGIVALTLSPALAAILLKTHEPNTFFNRFNNLFKKMERSYTEKTVWLMEKRKLAITIFSAAFLCTILFFYFMPKTFIPFEDQGYLVLDATLPSSASLNRTLEVSREISDIAMNQKGVRDIFSMTGWNLIDNIAQTQSGSYFVLLDDWNKRKGKSLQIDEIAKSLQKKVSKIPAAVIRNFNPPPIMGLAIVSGVDAWIIDQVGGSYQRLESVAKDFAKKGDQLKEMIFMETNISANDLQLKVNLDRDKILAYGLSISDITQALQSLLGYVYINDFVKYGRSFKVVLQGDPKYRANISDIDKVYVRSRNQATIPLGSLVSTEFTKGPNKINHYNGYEAARTTGYVNPFYSEGQAMNQLVAIAKDTLPQNMFLGWSGQAYEEKKSTNITTYIFLSALLMVFLILAALYEKWSLPLVVMMTIPFGVVGAFISIAARGITNDIYFQIGLIALIALAAKNAILIVQFALIKQKEGMMSRAAAILAAKLRLRAIIMTSLTFIVGVIPLVLSGGPGAASRHSVGTGVFGGMIFATLFGIFFVPFFYDLIERKK